MKGIIIAKIVNVVFYYFTLFYDDYYIEHNELEIKKVKPNKYITPICYAIAKRKGKYTKLELLYIVTEIYAHFILVLNAFSFIFIRTEYFGQITKYLFIGSLIAYTIILIAFRVINKINRKR